MADNAKQASSEYRLPIAYSQGFAQIRVYAFAKSDDVGPLAVPACRQKVDPDLFFAESVTEDGAELFRAD